MSWKRDAYFSGQMNPLPPQMPPEISSKRRRQMWLIAGVLALIGGGALLGLALAPEGPKELRAQLAAARKELQAQKAHTLELEQALREGDRRAGLGKLKAGDRLRHEREGRRYAAALKRSGAQAAADLMEWFVARWDQLLDYPQDDDRIGRRAAALALLVGGMAANVNPGDYVPWQAEFFNAHWLGDLHYDLDGDGLPGKRTSRNTHDGFANVSVCHVAMALNQSITDARVLMMPEMRCDRPESKLSVFLQGPTFDDALNEFVRAVREQGFIVVEKLDKAGIRLILVGARPPTPREE